MALQGGAPVTLAGQGAVPTWSPGQPAPAGYHVSPDGQSLISDATGQAVVSRPAINGNQTNANNPTSNTLVDKIFNDTPIGGTYNAISDAAHGDLGKAGGDFVQGQTYGTLPTGGNVVPQTETAIGKLPGTASDAGGQLVNGVGSVGAKLASGLGNVLSSAPDPSTDQIDSITNSALSSQQELDAIRRQAEANPTAAPQAGMVQLDQTNIDPLRQRQNVALDQLTAAANGTAPSAAEILAQDQINRAAAQAYGTAAAQQGGNSSGGTLRAALDAQQNLVGSALPQILANRAAEQATARQQLVQGIGNAQQQEGALATTNANLAQQTNLANQTSDINTRAQDINREQNLISGANSSQNTAEAAAKAALDAKVQEQANANAMKGAEINAGGAIVGNILRPTSVTSDERAKTNIRRADLVQLADNAPGYTFDYKDPRDGAGPRVGVMAQDVARSRLGKRLVTLTPDDELGLDIPNSVGAALAMSAQALREARAARTGR
ncbi:MAG TPA: tail fiber domain-containing protein [Candidatus Limnocylindria bacterium]|nr:tail fiber domain-containing protein [Candidatus Limnocylindria bacterium]